MNKNKNTTTNIQNTVVEQIKHIGDDPQREGLLDTPKRVAKMYPIIFGGYTQNVEELFTVFSAKSYDGIVLLKDIELYSMCEHHMLPFFGKAHIAYIPNEKVIGVSKLARILNVYSKRLQIQERIGEQVTDAIMEHLQPLGVACIIEATHMCMRMRGVEKQNSVMVTSSMRGVFRTDAVARQELLSLIHS